MKIYILGFILCFVHVVRFTLYSQELKESPLEGNKLTTAVMLTAITLSLFWVVTALVILTNLMVEKINEDEDEL